MKNAGGLDFGDIPFVGPASQEKLKYKVKGGNIAGFIGVGYAELKNTL